MERIKVEHPSLTFECGYHRTILLLWPRFQALSSKPGEPGTEATTALRYYRVSMGRVSKRSSVGLSPCTVNLAHARNSSDPYSMAHGVH